MSQIIKDNKDPLSQMQVESELSKQAKSRKKLKTHIEDRFEGFLHNENPILADKYAHKLKQL